MPQRVMDAQKNWTAQFRFQQEYPFFITNIEPVATCKMCDLFHNFHVKPLIAILIRR